MCIVDDPVEDGIGGRWLADKLMPLCHQVLTPYHRRFEAMAIFPDLEEVLPLGVGKRHHPVVDDEIDLRQPIEELAPATESSRKLNIADYQAKGRNFCQHFTEVNFRKKPCPLRNLIGTTQTVFIAAVKIIPQPLHVMMTRTKRGRLVSQNRIKSGQDVKRNTYHELANYGKEAYSPSILL